MWFRSGKRKRTGIPFAQGSAPSPYRVAHRVPLWTFGLWFLLGCGVHSMSGSMERWVGQDYAHVVERWGAPDLTADLPDGSKVLTWIKRYNAADKGELVEMVECRRSFTIVDGRVTKWSADGCPAYYVGSEKAP